MANFYALPGLSTWLTVGGWSSSSGGPSNGATPTINDDVFFDANSGASRTISLGNTTCPLRNLSLAGANAMTFAGGGTSGRFSCTTLGLLNFTGAVSFPSITLWGGSLLAGGAIMAGELTFGGIGSTTSSTIAGDLVFSSSLGVVNGDTASSLIIANGANVTAGHFTPSNNPVNYGTGTLTIRDAGTFTLNNNIGTNASNATIKFTCNTASTVIYNEPTPSPFSQFSRIWNACGPLAIFKITASNGAINPGIFKADGGSTTLIQAGVSLQASSWDVNGLGLLLTLSSDTPGTSSHISKPVGVAAEFGYSKIKDISVIGGGTWTARNSINNGNVGGITFIPIINNFGSFFF